MFSNISEYALTNNVFTISDLQKYMHTRRHNIEGYLTKRHCTKDEIRHYVPKKQKMAPKNMREKFIRLEKAKLINRTAMEYIRHPRDKPFKVSPLGWMYFWLKVKNPHRSYKEILLDRYETDPIVELFIRPYFQKQTVEYLVHDFYRGDDPLLLPGELPRYLEDCCRGLISDFLHIQYSEEFFSARLRNRVKKFIVDEILSLGREPPSFSFDWKDKKLLRDRVRQEVNAFKTIGHERGLVFAFDEKVMRLVREIENQFDQARKYLDLDNKERQLLLAQFAQIDS